MKYRSVIGTFDFKSPHGLYTATFDSELRKLEITNHYVNDINAGQLYYSHNHHVIYVCDETDGHDYPHAGGGRIYAYHVENDGSLRLLNYVDTLMTKTCYCCLSSDEKYLLYSNHTGRGTVTTVIRNDDGSFNKKIVMDDGGIGLIKLYEDGSLDKITDIYIHDYEFTEDHIIRHPHCHSINLASDGKHYIVCDKGMDRIYSYQVNADNRIELTDTYYSEKGDAPRYTVFHPSDNVFYESNETSNYVCVFRCDSKTGKLTRLQRVQLLETYEDSKASDIAITNDGRYLLVAVRDANKIVVFKINDDFTISKKGEYDSELSVRGFALTDDNKYLMTAHVEGMVKVFELSDEGSLSKVTETLCEKAGCIRFIGR